MKVLGIETSCDETAISVVENGTKLLSNVIASQVDIHSSYGGIVPEVASRQHVRDMIPTLEKALKDCKLCLEDLDLIAVTHGPGLAGSLISGLNTAKGLSLSLGKPLVGVNHIEGHIYASWLIADRVDTPDEQPGFPIACLVASGGHTDLILMERHGVYKLIGRTRDDAAGEAFDKAARILGLGFPGGPEIQKAAEQATGHVVEALPRAWMGDSLDFSFSGVKTALLHLAQKMDIYPRETSELAVSQFNNLVAELSDSFQSSVVDVIVTKLLNMAKRYHVKGVLLGGGVSANTHLRNHLISRSQLPVIIPPPILCTDNGAMIASCGYYQYQRGQEFGLDLDIDPSLSI